MERVLLAGATGLVGGHLARQLAAPGRRLLLTLRRPNPALAALPGVETLPWPPHAVPPVDLALCALGTTLAEAGSPAAFRAVDLDAVLLLARAAQAAGARRFGLVSALGADPTSRLFYNRVKGEAEAAIAALGFEQLVIAQPALLLGARPGRPPRRGEALGQALAPLFGPLTPARWRPIDAGQVARGLLAGLATCGPGVHRLSNAQLMAAR